MPRLRLSNGRPQYFAYYIAAPLALLTVVLAVSLAERRPIRVDEIPTALLLLVVMILAQAIVLVLEVRRHSLSVTIVEIPLLLALFYLSPVMVIIVRALACVAVQAFQRTAAVKVVYNMASVGLAAAVAALIAVRFPHQTATPRAWLVLGVAVATSAVISLASVLGVISLVQGVPPLGSMARASASVLVVTAANIMIGLIVLQVLQGEAWSVVLLVGLEIGRAHV